jgi:hypothetical protein
MSALKLLHQPWKQIWRNRWDSPDHEPAYRLPLAFINASLRIGYFSQDPLCKSPKTFSRFRQQHGAWQAVEQRLAQLGLEFLDLLAQRWLRHVYFLGSPRKTSFIRHCHEVSELMDFHSFCLSGSDGQSISKLSTFDGNFSI